MVTILRFPRSRATFDLLQRPLSIGRSYFQTIYFYINYFLKIYETKRPVKLKIWGTRIYGSSRPGPGDSGACRILLVCDTSMANKTILKTVGTLEQSMGIHKIMV